jgi:hypothetical protein
VIPSLLHQKSQWSGHARKLPSSHAPSQTSNVDCTDLTPLVPRRFSRLNVERFSRRGFARMFLARRFAQIRSMREEIALFRTAHSELRTGKARRFAQMRAAADGSPLALGVPHDADMVSP